MFIRAGSSFAGPRRPKKGSSNDSPLTSRYNSGAQLQSYLDKRQDEIRRVRYQSSHLTQFIIRFSLRFPHIWNDTQNDGDAETLGALDAGELEDGDDELAGKIFACYLSYCYRSTQLNHCAVSPPMIL